MLEFFATETWWQDSLPVIGEIFREFVKCYYQQNLFIRNQMRIDGAEIDLRKISYSVPQYSSFLRDDPECLLLAKH